MGKGYRKIDIDMAIVEERYRTGATLAEIANQFDVSITAIHKRLEKAGVERRDPSSSEFWTPERRAASRTMADAIHLEQGTAKKACMMCGSPMKRFGYRQARNFCNVKCAADWAEETIAAASAAMME